MYSKGLRGVGVGDKRVRFGRFVGLVLVLLIFVCALSLAGAYQAASTFRGLRRTVEEIVPFVELARKVTFQQLRQASDMKLALIGIQDSTLNMRERKAIFLAQSDFIQRERRILALYSEGEGILERLVANRSDPEWDADIGEAINLMSMLKDRQVEYEDMVKAISAQLATSSPTEVQLNVDEARRALQEKQDAIDQISSQLFSSVTRLLEGTLKSAQAQLRVNRTVVVGFGLIIVLLAIFLLLRIRELQKQLVESEQLAVLGKALVTLHHEINNPLAVIVGNVGLIRSGVTPESDRAKMLDEINQMALRVRDVLQRLGEIEEIRTTEYVKGTEMLRIGD